MLSVSLTLEVSLYHSYKWYNESWIGSVVGGRWESFVYHTRFVHDAPTGLVELWRNGVK